MLTQLEYALFAANSYATTISDVHPVVSPINEIKIPEEWGWDLVANGVEDTTGFLARAYKKGTEIVISYGGTTPENGLDWSKGNIPAALGTSLAPQVLDAAKFYLDVVNANRDATTISFTGHSLGGGLASLMAVYFNTTAQTFDQAPFGKTAASASIYNTLRGADICGLGRATGGLNGGRQALGDDAISLLPGAGLKGFKGLQEGMRHLG